MVIGRRSETEAFQNQAGKQVLNLPDEAWTLHVNDGWVMREIREGRSSLLTSKPSITNFRNVQFRETTGQMIRELTTFHRELKMLREAGYELVEEGDQKFMKTPPGWVAPDMTKFGQWATRTFIDGVDRSPQQLT